MTFTQKQIENFAAYEDVRESGVINMFDARQGAELAGITRAEYIFVMSNYEALSEAFEEANHHEQSSDFQ